MNLTDTEILFSPLSHLQRELNKQAVGRVAGWLSTGSGGIENKESSSIQDSPKKDSIQVPQSNIDMVNSPKTPSPSVMIPNGSGFPFPADDSATKSNLNPSKSSPSKKQVVEDNDRSIDAILRRSSYNSGKHKEEEIAPTLSADLRALVDSTDGSKARRLGTGLKDHPMSRKLSGSGDPSSFSDYKRERHTSLPSGPSLNSNSKGGYPGLIRSPSKAIPTASTFERASSGNSAKSTSQEQEKESKDELEEEVEDPNEEIKVPSRVIRALSSNNTTSSAASSGGGAIKARSTRSNAANDELSSGSAKPSGSAGGLLVSDPNAAAKYDARSARGGRGGRVASVASLWANIADGVDSGAKPVVAVKPKPRSSNNSKISGEGGAPALDFSQKKLDEKKQQLYKTPNLKATSAPHFINTTMPKPVFSSKEELEKKGEIPSPVKEEVKPNQVNASKVTSIRSNLNGSTIPSAVRNFSVPNASPSTIPPSSSSSSMAKPPSRYVSQPLAPIASSTSNSSMKLPTSNTSNSIRSISPSRSTSKNLSASNSNTSGLNASPSSSGSVHEFSAANFRSQSNSVSSRRQTVDFLTKPLDEAEKSKLKAAGLDVEKSAAGRGTTKPIGKNKMNELRGMFGA